MTLTGDKNTLSEEKAELIRPDFRNYVAIDIETTGLEPDQSSIIELGAARYVDGVEVSEYHTLVKLDGILPERNRRLTGIQPEQLETGKDLALALGELKEFTSDSLIICHNSKFDLGFLGYHMEKCGIEPMMNPALCTLHLAAMVHPEQETLQLSVLTEEWGIKSDETHRALQDARSAGLLAWELFGEIKKWKKEFVAHLATYRGKSDDAIFDLLENISGEKEKSYGDYRLDLNIFAPLKEPGGENVYQAFPGSERDDVEIVRDEILQSEVSEAFARGGITLIEDIRPGSIGATGNLSPEDMDVEKLFIGFPGDEDIQKKIIKNDRGTDGGGDGAFYFGKRSEYICMRRAFDEDGKPRGWIELSPFERTVLVRWLAGTKTGRPDRINWWLLNNFSGLKGTFNSISAAGLECVGPATPHTGTCFVQIASNRAQKASKIVVDLRHLFAATDGDFGAERTAGKFRHCVIEGGGKLSESARDACTRVIELDPLERRVSLVLSNYKGIDEKYVESLKSVESCLKDLIISARDLLHSQREISNYSDSGTIMLENDSWDYDDFLSLGKALDNSFEVLNSAGLTLRDTIDLDPDFRSLGNILLNAAGIFRDFRNIPENWHACLQGMPLRNPKRVSLKLIPLDVGHAFDKLRQEASGGIVITGRYLRYSDNFDYLKRQLRIEQGTDIQEKVMQVPESIIPPLFIPDDITPPSARTNKKYQWQKYIERTANLLRTLAESLEGHTVGAFSAHHDMKQVREALGHNPPNGSIVLAQYNDGTRSALVREYNENPATLLLGGRHFLDGIDLSPAGFTVLVVVKLPFSSPDAPVNRMVMQAAERDGLDGIRTHLVPMAVEMTNRWIDCLIPGASNYSPDRKYPYGAVIILDPRPTYQDWGDELIGALVAKPVVQVPFRDMLSQLKELKKRWTEQVRSNS